MAVARGREDGLERADDPRRVGDRVLREQDRVERLVAQPARSASGFDRAVDADQQPEAAAARCRGTAGTAGRTRARRSTSSEKALLPSGSRVVSRPIAVSVQRLPSESCSDAARTAPLSAVVEQVAAAVDGVRLDGDPDALRRLEAELRRCRAAARAAGTRVGRRGAADRAERQRRADAVDAELHRAEIEGHARPWRRSAAREPPSAGSGASAISIVCTLTRPYVLVDARSSCASRPPPSKRMPWLVVDRQRRGRTRSASRSRAASRSTSPSPSPATITSALLRASARKLKPRRWTARP